MSETPTITWKGQSGKEYKYYVYDLDATHDPVPANYIFTKKKEDNTHTPIYIGQTGNVEGYFDNHPKTDCLRKYGTTHVCTHKSSADEKVRRAEESDLIKKWTTPCND